jgi:phage terminase Nu1 subunit (DNA packaging protein)
MGKLIINCETGEIVERELNKAEKDQQKLDEAASKAAKTEAEARAAARQLIADRLGLSADELTLLLG